MSGLVELAGSLGPIRLAMLLLAAALVVALGASTFAERRRARLRPEPPASAGQGGPAAVTRCAGPGAAPGPHTAAVLALFGGLQPGDVLGRWTLDWIGRTGGGAVRVGLRDAAGNPFELELCRRIPGGPPPPARAGDLAVHLIAPAGGAVTPEEQGLGAMTLASYL